ncbi:MAG: hypothetical protein GWN14_23860 [candidate division Zixibacteria bacterium]|nr:hypothetical protein [candidate division Zixibacteria bacterium]
MLLVFCDLLILAGLAFLSPFQIIGVVLIFFFAAFFILSPLGYLYFLLIWIPYEPLILPEGESVRILRLFAIFTIILLGWLKYWLAEKPIRFPNKYIMVPILIFFGWSAITIFFSPFPFSAMFEFIKMLAFLAIFILVYNVIDSQTDLKKFLYFLFVISIPIYIAAYYQFFALGYLRVWGILGNPNTLGVFSVATTASALVLRELKVNSENKRTIVYVWIFLSISALILSGSRASIFSLIVFVAVYLYLRRKHVILLSLIIVGLIGIYYIFHSHALFMDFARVTRILGGLSGRTIIWETSLELIKDYPLFGVGPGNVSNLLYSYAQATHPIVTIDLRSAMERGMIHNGYLQRLAEIGIVGLSIVLWIIWRFMKMLYSRVRTNSSQSLGKISIVVLALFIGRLGHSLFESSLDIGPYTVELSVLLIYAAILKLHDTKN